MGRTYNTKYKYTISAEKHGVSYYTILFLFLLKATLELQTYCPSLKPGALSRHQEKKPNPKFCQYLFHNAAVTFTEGRK